MSLISRLKPLFSALFVIASLAVHAHAAGTLPIAMAQQVDINGRPLAGCLVNFFVAGTVATPQNSYSDFGLTQNPNNVVQCDQSGRVPMFWLADGLIHVRMTDASGVAVIDTTMQVLGPSSGGGGGGGTVDPTAIASTGDMKPRYGTGLIAGWVRMNGLTIGNAFCGCSERTNADTQTLWIYLYTTDPNLAVSGGRTGNALNDYNANKQLTLPDWRGRALAFLDDMGNSPAGRLTSSYFGASGIVLGAAGGAESQTLTLAQIPTNIISTNPVQAISVTSQDTGIPRNAVAFSGQRTDGAAKGIVGPGGGTVNIITGSVISTDLNAISVTSGNTSGQPHPIVQPTMLATIYMKL